MSARSSPTSPLSTSSNAAVRRQVVAVALFVASAVGLALVARLLRDDPAPPPTGDAEWIWATAPPDRAAPVAFFVAADFDLAVVPAAAELLAVADEEYVLYLNGHRVGSNTYSPGAPLDVYAVGGLLRPGANRLAAELRSGRGTGGFLACLRDPASGRVLAATGRGWRVAAAQRAGLAEGSLPLAGLPPASSWGRPPAGRWGVPARGPLRPLFERATASDSSAARSRLRAERYAVLGRPLDWRPANALGAAAGGGRGGADPPGLLLDWGREVYGYLSLRTRLPAPRPAALLFTGLRPLDPLAGLVAGGGGPPAEALDGLPVGAPVIAVPGRRNWTDTVPRRFRYAAVVGLRRLDAAWMEPVTIGEPEAALPQPPVATALGEGVFGVEPPPLRSPVEDEVRRELERLANLAGREDG